jgi:uncharacterized protein (DUF736 family)
MAEFDNTNRGVLFKNQYRKTEKHPDYTGNINVEGKELDLAAWVRKSKKGVVYISLSVSEPKVEDLTSEVESVYNQDIDEDIPY